jgi:competence protein ComEA
MKLSIWRRKNSLMTISESKIKGLTAVCLMLAVIPFISYFFNSFSEYKIPALGSKCDDCVAIEIVDGGHSAGVYYVAPGTTANQLLKSSGIEGRFKNDFQLKAGIKLMIDSVSKNKDAVVSQMKAADKLSLGLPIDINRATEDDLRLIKGIGPATAQNIMEMRKKINRFENIEQLMEIKGIKEKRLAQFRKYLYVEKRKE